MRVSLCVSSWWQLCVCLWLCVFACTHSVCASVCICVRCEQVRVRTFLHACVRACVNLCTRTCVFVCARESERVYVCMCVRTRDDRMTYTGGHQVWEMVEGGSLRDEPMMTLSECANSIFDATFARIIGTASNARGVLLFRKNPSRFFSTICVPIALENH